MMLLRSIFSIAVISLLATASTFAQQQLAPIAYLKTGPVVQTLEKLETVVSAITPPGEETPDLVKEIGDDLGDPGLKSFVDGTGVTIVVLNAMDSQAPFVGIAKMTADAPLRQKFEAEGVTLRDQGGWTFIAAEESLLNRANLQGLVDFANQKAQKDIEAGAWVNRALNPNFRLMAAGGLAQALAGGFDQAAQERAATIRDVATAVLDEIAMVDTIRAFVDLNPDTIVLTQSIKAMEGTPLDELFGNQPKMKVEEAKFVPDTGYLSFAFASDYSAVGEFIGGQANRIANALPEKWAPTLRKFGAAYSDLADKMEGTAAMTMDLDGMAPKYVEVVKGELGHEDYSEMAEVMKQIFQGGDDKPGIQALTGFGMTYDYIQEAGEVNGIPYGTAKTIISMPGMLEVPEDQPSPFNQTQYIAFVNGYAIIATDLEELGEIGAHVKNGTAVDNAISEWVQMKDGQVLDMRLDIKRYAEAMLTQKAAYGGGTDEETERARKMLAEIDAEPLRIDAFSKPGEVVLNTHVPVSSIAAISKWFIGVSMRQSFEQEIDAQEDVEVQESQPVEN